MALKCLCLAEVPEERRRAGRANLRSCEPSASFGWQANQPSLTPANERVSYGWQAREGCRAEAP